MPSTTETRNSLLGPTVVIRGELTARQEQLTIMGTVEGTIDHDQALTIHRDGKVKAEIRAREVVVEGTVDGNVHGTQRVRIAEMGRVNGNVYTQLFSVDEGAKIKGRVVMDADAETIEQRFRAASARETLPANKAAARTGTESKPAPRESKGHRDE